MSGMSDSFLTGPLTGAGTIGLISGSGPEAGIDLWGKVLIANRRYIGASFRGDIDVPRTIIHSDPVLGLSMDLRRFEREVWSALEHVIGKVEASVDVYGIACNTLHHFEPAIRRREHGHKLISIVDAARELIQGAKIARGALLGSAPIMDVYGRSPYRALTNQMEIEPVESSRVEAVIYAVKRFGPEEPSTITNWMQLLSEIASPVILLACTELPLLPKPPDKVCIDLTEALANKLIQHAYMQEPSNSLINVNGEKKQ
jgi:aspartate racemase